MGNRPLQASTVAAFLNSPLVTIDPKQRSNPSSKWITALRFRGGDYRPWEEGSERNVQCHYRQLLERSMELSAAGHLGLR
ncbi:hypothetical protein Mapa_007926 [Marchantia paleacea]|nr:hypothetical protein Mapa_007926 [Marchantia paleacea]